MLECNSAAERYKTITEVHSSFLDFIYSNTRKVQVHELFQRFYKKSQMGSALALKAIML